MEGDTQTPGGPLPRAMLDRVAHALHHQDYATAARLLKQWLQDSPQDPWAQLYVGRLQEVTGKSEAAEQIYRRLLQQAADLPKLVSQARQGLQRLEVRQNEQRQQAIAAAVQTENGSELGCLVLEGVAGESRQGVLESFAKCMKLDLYHARTIFPSRGWRLYRLGPIGELQVYQQELAQAHVPAQCLAFAALQPIQVFQVDYFQALSPHPIAVCRNADNQLGAIPFHWSEVRHQVTGLLPLFERVIDLGYRNQLERKEQTHDYARLYDLQLPQRRSILRLYDRQFGFDRCASRGLWQQDPSTTNRIRWDRLLQFLSSQLPKAQHWTEFTLFGETAADFAEPILRLSAHSPIVRDRDCYWDAAFHLYSSLIFYQT